MNLKIIYPVPELFPDNRARFIQIINTCHKLAQSGANVTLLTGLKKGFSEYDILKYYGLPSLQSFRITRLPILRAEKKGLLRFSWNGVFHYSLLLYLFAKRYTFERTFLYLRHLKLAHFLLKYKKLLNISCLFEVHEIFYKNTISKNKHKLKSTEIKVFKDIDKIICISRALKDCLINLDIPEEKIYIVPDGVRDDWFNVEKKLGKYICYTGSLYRWKGVDILISAMKYLPDEYLLIVGGGKRLNDLQELARQENVLNRVKFTENVPHFKIPEYLSYAKIAVLPNIFEGPSKYTSPLKLFEYMASGIPIVASNIPVFHEILEDGENAILFEPGNPGDLAKSIRKILNNPELYKKLSIAAKKEAEKYTYKKRAERILKVLNETVIKK